MDSPRDFWSIRAIIFVTRVRSILLDLERGPKNFTSPTKRVASQIHA
jgi:hypothetical protein